MNESFPSSSSPYIWKGNAINLEYTLLVNAHLECNRLPINWIDNLRPNLVCIINIRPCWSMSNDVNNMKWRGWTSRFGCILPPLYSNYSLREVQIISKGKKIYDSNKNEWPKRWRRQRIYEESTTGAITFNFISI